MKNNKIILIFFYMMIICHTNSFAFIGAVSGITKSLDAAAQKAYYAFMKIKIVEQIRILKQNYLGFEI